MDLDAAADATADAAAAAASGPSRTRAHIELAQARAAHNYHPLPVVVSHGEGAWVTDVEGRRYLDLLAGYSALNFGHGHPTILAAARAQLDELTLTSRAFHHDRFGQFVSGLADLCSKDMVLPANTGAEAVEAALKVARLWGYEVKGIPDGEAEVVVAGGNFHGRTITIVSFSDDPLARDGFGPYTPGFVRVPFGDADALAAALGPRTAAVLLEPVQGEAGVVIPPDGYLRAVRAATARAGVLLMADEIQSGLGRTGRTFACDHEQVEPDVYVLGKALGGGIVPVSAVVANRDVLGVLRPGQHGSTFGGNALASAVGSAVVDLLATGEYQQRAQVLGKVLAADLEALVGHGLLAVRSRGLWAGLDVDPALGTGRDVCERLLAHGVLAKDTHGSTLRLAPPLVIEEDALRWGVAQLAEVLAELAKPHPPPSRHSPQDR
jgi:ornithine--oxo-acid transaminase